MTLYLGSFSLFYWLNGLFHMKKQALVVIVRAVWSEHKKMIERC